MIDLIVKLTVVVGILAVVGFLALIFTPLGAIVDDCLLALRLRSAKKHVQRGKEALSALDSSITDIKAKMAQDDKYACLDPLLKSLVAHRTRFAARIEAFGRSVEIAEQTRAIVNQKPTPDYAEYTDEKIDKFLKALNGDK